MTKEQRKWKRMNSVQLQFDFNEVAPKEVATPKVVVGSMSKQLAKKSAKKYKIHPGLNKLPIGDYLYLKDGDVHRLRYVEYEISEDEIYMGIEDESKLIMSYPWHCVYEMANEDGSKDVIFFSLKSRFVFGRANKIYIHSIARMPICGTTIKVIPMTEMDRQNLTRGEGRSVCSYDDRAVDTVLPSEKFYRRK